MLLGCSKLINVAVPGTIDERAINTKRVLNPWERNENHTLCLNSAKAVGCTVVNIGTQDFIEGRVCIHAFSFCRNAIVLLLLAYFCRVLKSTFLLWKLINIVLFVWLTATSCCWSDFSNYQGEISMVI